MEHYSSVVSHGEGSNMANRYISTISEAANYVGVSAPTMKKWINRNPSANESVEGGFVISTDTLDKLADAVRLIRGSEGHDDNFGGGDDGK